MVHCQAHLDSGDSDLQILLSIGMPACHSPSHCRFDCIDDEILERHFAIDNGSAFMTVGTTVGPLGQPPSEYCLDARLLERSMLNSGDSDDDDLDLLFPRREAHRVHLSRSVGIRSYASIDSGIVNSVKPSSCVFNATTPCHRQSPKGYSRPLSFTPQLEEDRQLRRRGYAGSHASDHLEERYNPPSAVTRRRADQMYNDYVIPMDIEVRVPFEFERADHPQDRWVAFYELFFEAGLRLPIL